MVNEKEMDHGDVSCPDLERGYSGVIIEIFSGTPGAEQESDAT
jgi:hypothetical protein